MSIKTRKSFQKRIKLTKNGKLLSRKAGQNHFNAKERTGVANRKAGFATIKMDNKSKSKFLVNM